MNKIENKYLIINKKVSKNAIFLKVSHFFILLNFSGKKVKRIKTIKRKTHRIMKKTQFTIENIL